MGLDEYRRKRDFGTSPEPSGDERPARTARRKAARYFCVHKHLSSHLHYDLRLEHDGVLRSWAVPKGPSLDPSVKRLAMAVEDHPLAYGTFEGVIPEGYGAGIVMLWDQGTWMPESDDVDRALAKGDLKFTLDGYKLKGSWVLVRTRGYGDARGQGRSWLLIKHRDEWSGDLDITEFAPDSVKSGEGFAGILADESPDVWQSGRPARSGETGAMLQTIVEEAAALRHERAEAVEAPKRRSASRAATSGKARPVKRRPTRSSSKTPSRKKTPRKRR